MMTKDVKRFDFWEAECSPSEEERIAMRGRLAEVIRSFRESRRRADTAAVCVRFFLNNIHYRVGATKGKFPLSGDKEWQHGA